MPVALPLPTRIDSSSSKSSSYKSIVAKFGDGFSQRTPNGINNKVDAWTVIWRNLNQTDRNTVVTVLKSIELWDYITWTPIGESVIKKFTIVDTYNESYNGTYYNVTVKLQQIQDLNNTDFNYVKVRNLSPSPRGSNGLMDGYTDIIGGEPLQSNISGNQDNAVFTVVAGGVTGKQIIIPQGNFGGNVTWVRGFYNTSAIPRYTAFYADFTGSDTNNYVDTNQDIKNLYNGTTLTTVVPIKGTTALGTQLQGYYSYRDGTFTKAGDAIAGWPQLHLDAYQGTANDGDQYVMMSLYHAYKTTGMVKFKTLADKIAYGLFEAGRWSINKMIFGIDINQEEGQFGLYSYHAPTTPFSMQTISRQDYSGKNCMRISTTVNSGGPPYNYAGFGNWFSFPVTTSTPFVSLDITYRGDGFKRQLDVSIDVILTAGGIKTLTYLLSLETAAIFNTKVINASDFWDISNIGFEPNHVMPPYYGDYSYGSYASIKMVYNDFGFIDYISYINGIVQDLNKWIDLSNVTTPPGMALTPLWTYTTYTTAHPTAIANYLKQFEGTPTCYLEQKFNNTTDTTYPNSAYAGFYMGIDPALVTVGTTGLLFHYSIFTKFTKDSYWDFTWVTSTVPDPVFGFLGATIQVSNQVWTNLAPSYTYKITITDSSTPVGVDYVFTYFEFSGEYKKFIPWPSGFVFPVAQISFDFKSDIIYKSAPTDGFRLYKIIAGDSSGTVTTANNLSYTAINGFQIQFPSSGTNNPYTFDVGEIDVNQIVQDGPASDPTRYMGIPRWTYKWAGTDSNINFGSWRGPSHIGYNWMSGWTSSEFKNPDNQLLMSDAIRLFMKDAQDAYSVQFPNRTPGMMMPRYGRTSWESVSKGGFVGNGNSAGTSSYTGTTYNKWYFPDDGDGNASDEWYGYIYRAVLSIAGDYFISRSPISKGILDKWMTWFDTYIIQGSTSTQWNLPSYFWCDGSFQYTYRPVYGHACIAAACIYKYWVDGDPIALKWYRRLLDDLFLNKRLTATGSLQGISRTTEGSGYTTANVVITGNGTGASATANIHGGKITSYNIISAGSGYTTISATVTGDGTGATCHAYLNDLLVGAFDPNHTGWEIAEILNVYGMLVNKGRAGGTINHPLQPTSNDITAFNGIVSLYSRNTTDLRPSLVNSKGVPIHEFDIDPYHNGQGIENPRYKDTHARGATWTETIGPSIFAAVEIGLYTGDYSWLDKLFGLCTEFTNSEVLDRIGSYNTFIPSVIDSNYSLQTDVRNNFTGNLVIERNAALTIPNRASLIIT